MELIANIVEVLISKYHDDNLYRIFYIVCPLSNLIWHV